MPQLGCAMPVDLETEGLLDDLHDLRERTERIPASCALVGSVGGFRFSGARGRRDLAPPPRGQAVQGRWRSICRASQRHS